MTDTLTIDFFDGYGDETHGVYDYDRSDTAIATGTHAHCRAEALKMQAGDDEFWGAEHEGADIWDKAGEEAAYRAEAAAETRAFTGAGE